MINIKDFVIFQKVLLYNSQLCLFLGKLKTKWMGPYKVSEGFSYGIAEFENQGIGEKFKVNGYHLKPYIEGSFELQRASVGFLD